MLEVRSPLRARRAFSLSELAVASIFFLLVATAATLVAAKALSANANSTARVNLEARMEAALDVLARTSFDELVDESYTVPEPCPDADGQGSQGTSCFEFPGRTFTGVWEQETVRGAFDSFDLAERVTLRVSSTLPDGTPVTRQRTVNPSTSGFGDAALLRVRLSGDRDQVSRVYVVDADTFAQRASGPVGVGGTAMVVVPADACTTAAPCRLGLSAGPGFTTNGSVYLSAADVVGPDVTFVAAAGEVTQMAADVHLPAGVDVRFDAEGDPAAAFEASCDTYTSVAATCVVDDTDHIVLAYTEPGAHTFAPPGETDVEVLVVAGGGGGGGRHGAGGGAGGVRSEVLTVDGPRTVVVGDGGAGAQPGTGQGANGETSSFGSLTAAGGGGGGSWDAPRAGRAGGSGGGGAGHHAVGSGIAGQGHDGGAGFGSGSGPYNHGGGGGAGEPGAPATETAHGDGGDGLEFPQFALAGGSPAGWFAGGGGGGGHNPAADIRGVGGAGGGGDGGTPGVVQSGDDGVAGTGGGGGGASTTSGGSGKGGDGGSGAVFVRFPRVVEAPAPTNLPTGGDVTVITDNGTTYRVHTFTTSGTFDPQGSTRDVEYLVVGGGGGGGTSNNGSGGGGGGGVVTGSATVSTSETVTVGDGGAGGPSTTPFAGQNGQPSLFGSIAAASGGGGGGGAGAGSAGGSGGGGGVSDGSLAGGAGIAGQGNDGGDANVGDVASQRHGGGGGGAAGAGSPGAVGGDGGAGQLTSITGTPMHVGGGGGGGRETFGQVGVGGVGGGGDGGHSGEQAATPGIPNTGGGGGGGGSRDLGTPGADGGLGVVVVRYPITGVEGLDVPRTPANVANSVCVYATFDAGAGPLEVPVCNDAAGRALLETYQPFDERPDVVLALAPGTDVTFAVDRASGVCGAPGQVGATADGWVPAPVCTSWTWGVPTFMEIGPLRVALDDARLTASTPEPARGTIVFTGDLARPAAGYPGQPQWTNPRQVGECAETASCTSLGTAVPEELQCPGGHCLAVQRPYLVAPLSGQAQVPSVRRTETVTAFTLAVADTGDRPVTVTMLSAPQAGMLAAGDMALSSSDVIGTTPPGGGSFELSYVEDSTTGIVWFTVRLDNGEPNGTRDYDIVLWRSDDVFEIRPSTVTVPQGSTVPATVEVVTASGAPATGETLTVSTPTGLSAPASVTVDGPAAEFDVTAAPTVNPGTYTVTLSSGGRTGSLTVTVTGVLDTITVAAPASATQGDTFDVTVTATDRSGNPIGGVFVDVNGDVPWRSGLLGARYDGYHADNMSFFDSTSPTDVFNEVTTVDLGNEGTHYSYLWEGFIVPAVSGTWTLRTDSDDSSLVWVGDPALSGYTIGNAVVNNSGTHGVQTRTGTVELTAGQPYPVRIAYGQAGGGAAMRFWYQPPSGSMTQDLTGVFFSYADINGVPTGGEQTFTIDDDVVWAHHTFTSNGTFRAGPAERVVDYLVVGGGGGGGVATGAHVGGGGGGGGVAQGTAALVGDVPVVVGTGGVGGSTNLIPAESGQPSSLLDIAAPGGGAGAGGHTLPAGDGSSGGGGASSGHPSMLPSGTPGGAGTPGFGHPGGAGWNLEETPFERAGGGGGGAGAPGGTAAPYTAGDGGAGIVSSIPLVPAHFGGGGGASTQAADGQPGAGGLGGGGDGRTPGLAASPGIPGTGGGGGGAPRATSTQFNVGGTGADGVVVARYALSGPSSAATGITASPGGCFTSSAGTCTVTVTVQPQVPPGAFALVASHADVSTVRSLRVTSAFESVTQSSVPALPQGAQTVVSATAVTAAGTPAANTELTFGPLPDQLTVVPAATVTDAAGRFSVTVSVGGSRPTGVVDVPVAAAGVTAHLRVRVTATPANMVPAGPTTVPQGASSTVPVTVTDASGAPVEGVRVWPSTSTAGLTVVPAFTDSQGVAGVHVSAAPSTELGSMLIGLEIRDASGTPILSDSASVEVVSAPTAVDMVGTAQRNRTSTVNATVVDGFGNPVPEVTVTLQGLPDGVVAPETVTGSNGVAPIPVSTLSTPAGLYQVTAHASMSGVTITPQVGLRVIDAPDAVSGPSSIVVPAGSSGTMQVVYTFDGGGPAPHVYSEHSFVADGAVTVTPSNTSGEATVTVAVAAGVSSGTHAATVGSGGVVHEFSVVVP